MASIRPPCCGTAVRRQIRSASEGIWITDGILARAFERYCTISPAARRHVSFVPGPLESRRRLGRRHMTELYSFQSHGSLPPWALEVPADYGKWHWHAPTPLEDWSGHNTEEQVPVDTSKSWSQFLLGSFSPGAEASASAEGWVDGLDASEDDVYRDMHWLIEQVRSKDLADINPSFEIYTESLEAQATNGNLTPSHLYHLLATLPKELIATYGHSRLSASLVTGLLDTISRVVASAEAVSPEYLEYRFWNLFLNQLALLNGHRGTYDLFAQIMALVPRQYLDHLGDAVGTLLVSISRHHDHASDGLLSSASISPTMSEIKDTSQKPQRARNTAQGPQPHMSLRNEAISIAHGLGRFEGDVHQKLLKKLVDTAIHSVKSESQRSVRIFWLSVLARIPNVKQDFMFRMMAEHFGTGSGAETLSDVEISQLLAIQWASRGYIAEADRLWLATEPRTEGSMLACFSRAICRTLPRKVQVPVLMSLCKCLSEMGRLHALADSFEVLCREWAKVSAGPMALIASACNDHTLALKLHRLTETHARKFHGGAMGVAKVWDWRLWARYMKQLREDEAVGPRQLRALLGVHPKWSRSRSADPIPAKHETGVGLSKRTVDLLEQSAEDIVRCFATDAPSDRRLDRTALYLVETRIRYLTAHGVELSPRIIKTLTRLLTVDLVDGQPGRTSRFEWLVGLIATHQGHEAAEAAGQALSRWRVRNAMFHQRELDHTLALSEAVDTQVT